MVRIGVLGAGHLGKIHLRCLGMLPEIFDVVGVYDRDREKAMAAGAEFGVQVFGSQEEMMEHCEAVDIVTPTLSHFDCAVKAVRSFKHIFVEKPLTNTVEEGRDLLKLVSEAKVKAQVGHVERFNPAFVAARSHLTVPRFIESHRLAQFNPRGTDVSVVLDLMIHDIDIILATVGGNVMRISAGGAAVLSDTPDIANARLEFDNGCVANLTASRISLKNMRKSRFFQKDAYISVDFLEKSAEIVRMRPVVGEPDPFSVVFDLGEGKGQRELLFEKPSIPETNAIRDELQSFGQSILTNQPEVVTLNDGFRALETAHRILEIMKTPSSLGE